MLEKIYMETRDKKLCKMGYVKGGENGMVSNEKAREILNMRAVDLEEKFHVDFCSEAWKIKEIIDEIVRYISGEEER